VVKGRKAEPKRNFYLMLGVAALVGIALIYWLAIRPKDTVAVTPVTGVPAAESKGYVRGSASAPVEIVEFADFQCPACEQYATITEPDVMKRIVDAGLARYVFYDFPLQMHPNAWPASHAAACADDQGKFWEMHDVIFREQPNWSRERNPKGSFERLAREIGLDVAAWETCYDERRHERRIAANLAEGERRGVGSTPTFFIGDRKIAGVQNYDQIRAHVDSATRRAAAARGTADSAPGSTPGAGRDSAGPASPR
jgi:protein-disulfide isomerase